MFAQKKILILAPPPLSSGGVASYVAALKGSWPAKEKYFFRGSTGTRKAARLLLLAKEYLSFLFTCLFFPSFKTVLVNTSMGRKAFQRDSLFILIARLLGKQVYVFIHGWDEAYFSALPNKKLAPLFKARKLFVLSEGFKQALQQKGYQRPIVVETTVIDNAFMNEVTTNDGPQHQPGRFLYLARLEPEKGVLLLLEAFQQVSARYPKAHLDIAGFGSLESDIKAAINSTLLQNISYHGLVKGKEKTALFKQSSIYVLPTSHGEGMPISVLEAMAAGLVVITTSAGALQAFFRHGEMGYQLNQVSAGELAAQMETALQTGDRNATISRFNSCYARNHFTVATVINRLEKEILNDQ